VMEYLDGVTLRYKIGGRPLDLEETLRYAIEIVDALDAAHATGIIHRDIKTANVLITKRGQAKVLDFGLAKLMADVQGGGPNDPTMAVNELTTAGDTLGTVAYMSPEQIEGKPLDGRTDVFSFGIVLYEMATGRSPFEKQTKGATFGAILHEQPIPPGTLNAGIPTRLEETIEKTLEKNKELRYQHASEIRADLQRLKRDLESGRVSSQNRTSEGSDSGIAVPRPVSDGGSILQPGKMRPSGWWKVIVASLVLVALAVGTVALWRIRTKSKLAAKDMIVVADFSNTTGESIFDDTLRQALAAQLSQSPFLNVLPDRRVAAILKQMQRTPLEHLTQTTAREVCLRSGSQAMLVGSISNAGDR
jgi:eukaryotic-like serine/threonine-protein kinase